MAHDPVVEETVRVRDSLEPRFVLEEQERRADASLARFRGSTGKRPNILMVLFDDVGWGDFGCYGGGVAVGAPTPNIDKLARRGLLLTSAYSELPEDRLHGGAQRRRTQPPDHVPQIPAEAVDRYRRVG